RCRPPMIQGLTLLTVSGDWFSVIVPAALSPVRPIGSPIGCPILQSASRAQAARDAEPRSLTCHLAARLLSYCTLLQEVFRSTSLKSVASALFAMQPGGGVPLLSHFPSLDARLHRMHPWHTGNAAPAANLYSEAPVIACR